MAVESRALPAQIPMPTLRSISTDSPYLCDVIEECVDIAQRICSAQGWGPPADNGDAMKVLGRHGTLTAA
nr:hypothetical protein [Mycobacterium simiae]